jgi:hypothetical protein
MNVITEIVDPFLTITLGQDSIVRIRWVAATTITEAAARRSLELFAEASGSRRLPLLVDMSEVKAMTREARGVFADDRAMLALALVGQSPVVQVIANFALGLSRPSVPTKFFTSAQEAETWLLGFQA